MENQFKLRISRMLRSSFSSCKSNKNLTDVIEKPSLIDLFSPRPNFPSVCKPRKKVTESRRSLLLAADFMEGEKCPPASPADHDQYSKLSKVKSKKKVIYKRVRARSRTNSFGLLDEFPDFSYNGLFSSDDDDDDEEDDKTTLFSSRSLSSDSSESFRRNKGGGIGKKKKKKNIPPRRKASAAGGRRNESTIVPLEETSKVKDSFAVVKRSSDPYSDFRRSMLEMIIEKQLFEGKDLENLLECFLSLNSNHHHQVIIQVFTEIWEALFSV